MGAGTTSTGNATTTPLASGATFTGEWEDVSAYSSVVVAVKADQDGTFTVQFSPDGVNADSTLTRYYRTAQIEAPHRFTITRPYCRVTFTNTSASTQTVMRLTTMYGLKGDMNAPTDSTLAQDFDAIVTRPTDYRTEVALGRRQGATLWNKFGYNEDVDVATSPEVVASWGGTFTPMTTAATLSIVSTDAADQTSTGTGARNVVVYGVDANRKAQTEVVQMTGTTPVVTSSTWLGINRIAVGLAGSGQINAGTITATETGGSTIQGQMPAGEGTTQQCIFFVQDDHTALFEWLKPTVIRFGAGTEPVVTIRAWVYSPLSNARYEVARITVDAGVDTKDNLSPPLPFPVVGPAVFWLEATTTRDNTQVIGRISCIEHRAVDA